MNAKHPAVRTIIVTDLTGRPEDDVTEILSTFEVHGIKLDVIKHANEMSPVEWISADLLVIDYGGLSVAGYGRDAWKQVRLACRWADDHPGVPVVIWTYYTAQIYDDELRGEFGYLKNVLIRYPHDRYHTEASGFWNTLSSWLGLKRRNPCDTAKQ